MVKLVGMSGSLREGSFNAALLRAAVELVPDGVELTVGTIAGIPLYNADIESGEGIPQPVGVLVSRAQSVFDAAGALTDEAIKNRLRQFVQGFAAFAAKD